MWFDDIYRAGLPEDPVKRAAAVMVMQAGRRPSWLSVLDWAGLLDGGSPSASGVVAARHGITVPTLRERRTQVRKTAARRILPNEVWMSATRPSRPGEDHEARARWAWLLSVPTPDPAVTAEPFEITVAQRDLARQGAQILAALGPMSLEALVECVRRPQARAHRTVEEEHLELVLRFTQLATEQDGVWTAVPEVNPNPRHIALLHAAAVAGRPSHTRTELQQVFAAAGQVAAGPSVTYHPLLYPAGRGQWSFRTTTPSGSSRASSPEAAVDGRKPL